MRKGLAIVMGAAILFAGASSSYAAAAATEYDRMEANHSDYGAGAWHTAVDALNGDGDESYGYVTNWSGEGLGYLNTNPGAGEALIAPDYTDPCPADIMGGSGYNMNDPTLAGCPSYNAVDAPQTNTSAFGADNDWDAGVLDDLLSKMYDTANPENSITQQLDILFVNNISTASIDDNSSTANVTSARLFIDQTLDQDLTFYEGDISSYMTTGDGIKNRVAQVFVLDNAAGKKNSGLCAEGTNASCGQEDGEYLRIDDSLMHDAHDADLMDQWVVGYTKDFGSTMTPSAGIVSSYSSWVKVVNGPRDCGADCTYQYTGHDPIDKTVQEIDGHPGSGAPVP